MSAKTVAVITADPGGRLAANSTATVYDQDGRPLGATPVPERHSHGGALAPMRIGEALAELGYRPVRGVEWRKHRGCGCAEIDVEPLVDDQAAGEPVRVNILIEAHPYSEDVEWARAEWDAMTPAQRRRAVDEAVQTAFGNAGGGGARFENDDDEPGSTATAVELAGIVALVVAYGDERGAEVVEGERGSLADVEAHERKAAELLDQIRAAIGA